MTLPSNSADRRSCAAHILWLTGLLALGGCAQLQAFKTRIDSGPAHAPASTVSVAKSPSPPPPQYKASPLPPAIVVTRDLQYGHYAAGRAHLRGYLRLHPGDPAAKALLHQLTVDPETELGRHWRAHRVRPGESYGSLAQRYLGNANRFVILARYNHAANPSKLRVGQTIRLPLSAATDGKGHRGAGRSASDNEDKASQAERLQKQAVALLAKGHRQQALKRLGQALRIDPQLPSDGPKSTTLRKQLLASYHQRAIVLYRDQHLDRAIALWNQVLAIDPHYEAARVYRARAKELKQRLQQLH